MTISLHVFLGLFLFLLFFISMFPLETIVNDNVSRLNGYRITYAKMEPSLIFGSTFKKVRVEKNGVKGDVFYIPELTVSVSLWRILFGTVDLALVAELERGEILGNILLDLDVWSGFKIKSTDVALKLDQVPLSATSLIPETVEAIILSFSPQGRFSGTARVQLVGSVFKTPKGESYSSLVPKTASVKLQMQGLKFTDFQFGPIPILMPDATHLDVVALAGVEKGEISLTLNGREIEIESLVLPGEDIEFQMGGRVTMSPSFQPERLALRGRFAFSEKVRNALLVLLSQIESQKRPDGFYTFSISGNPQQPSIRIGQFDLMKAFQMGGTIPSH